MRANQMAKTFDPFSHKYVERGGPYVSERHVRPTSEPSPRGGFDKMGRHDEIHQPQHPERARRKRDGQNQLRSLEAAAVDARQSRKFVEQVSLR
jgi:hypothetical protein